MKILIIGILSFFVWSTLSTYIYVCNIKELCGDPITKQMIDVRHENSLVTDTLQKTSESEQVTLPEDLNIYFAFDKSEFNSNKLLSNYYAESNAFMNQNTQAMLEITGHTDAVGTINYNVALGFRRAQSLQRFFESKGINGDKITILSKGENEPIDNNDTEEGRANNRRTVITIKK